MCRGMVKSVLLVGSVVAGLHPFALYGQELPHRTIKKAVQPRYPEMARHLNIHGTVRVEVTISADGKVKSTRVVGGHPLLVDAADQAAKRIEFEAGAKVTSQIVEFKFTDTEQ